MTRTSADDVAKAYDFSSARTVVDVGGGNGGQLSAILRANPAARGVLFDLDDVVTAARAAVQPEIAARLQFAGGDFGQDALLILGGEDAAFRLGGNLGANAGRGVWPGAGFASPC